MFNLNITSSFFGVFPNVIYISEDAFSNAIEHYERAFNARAFRTGESTTVVSNHGFSFRVVQIQYSSRQAVRLGLPSDADREAVAIALRGNTGSYSTSSTGIIVNDPFDITWTIAWFISCLQRTLSIFEIVSASRKWSSYVLVLNNS